MVAKKAAKLKKPTWERIVLPISGIIIVLGLVFALLYFNNRPNYRDLQKEFERISANIPADWQLVSESSNKGTWGLFCLQIEGSECPHLIVEYQRSALSGISPAAVIEELENILLDSGFTLLDDSYQKCSDSNIEDDDYTCSASGSRDSIRANVSIKSKAPAGEIGDWSSLSLSSYEK
jgi:hypothetical protein